MSYFQAYKIDHTHILVSMPPDISCSKLMGHVKSGSSNWLNSKQYIPVKFKWQDGYGAFTYSKSHVDNVVKYILNQPIHHKKQSFKDEYKMFLDNLEIDYDPKYLFEWYL